MIDNPDQAERLFARLQTALPPPAARVTPELARATLQTKNHRDRDPDELLDHLDQLRRRSTRVGSCAGSASSERLKPQPSLQSPTCASTLPLAGGARHRRLPEAPR